MTSRNPYLPAFNFSGNSNRSPPPPNAGNLGYDKSPGASSSFEYRRKHTLGSGGSSGQILTGTSTSLSHQKRYDPGARISPHTPLRSGTAPAQEGTFWGRERKPSDENHSNGTPISSGRMAPPLGRGGVVKTTNLTSRRAAAIPVTGNGNSSTLDPSPTRTADQTGDSTILSNATSSSSPLPHRRRRPSQENFQTRPPQSASHSRGPDPLHTRLAPSIRAKMNPTSPSTTSDFSSRLALGTPESTQREPLTPGTHASPSLLGKLDFDRKPNGERRVGHELPPFDRRPSSDAQSAADTSISSAPATAKGGSDRATKSSKYDPMVQQAIDEAELNKLKSMASSDLRKTKRRCKELRSQVSEIEKQIKREPDIGRREGREKLLVDIWQTSRRYHECQRAVLQHNLAILVEAVKGNGENDDSERASEEVAYWRIKAQNLSRSVEKTEETLKQLSSVRKELQYELDERNGQLGELKAELQEAKQSSETNGELLQAKEREISALSTELEEKNRQIEFNETRHQTIKSGTQQRANNGSTKGDNFSDSAVDTSYDEQGKNAEALNRRIEKLRRALEEEQEVSRIAKRDAAQLREQLEQADKGSGPVEAPTSFLKYRQMLRELEDKVADDEIKLGRLLRSVSRATKGTMSSQSYSVDRLIESVQLLADSKAELESDLEKEKKAGSGVLSATPVSGVGSRRDIEEEASKSKLEASRLRKDLTNVESDLAKTLRENKSLEDENLSLKRSVEESTASERRLKGEVSSLNAQVEALLKDIGSAKANARQLEEDSDLSSSRAQRQLQQMEQAVKDEYETKLKRMKERQNDLVDSEEKLVNEVFELKKKVKNLERDLDHARDDLSQSQEKTQNLGAVASRNASNREEYELKISGLEAKLREVEGKVKADYDSEIRHLQHESEAKGSKLRILKEDMERQKRENQTKLEKMCVEYDEQVAQLKSERRNCSRELDSLKASNATFQDRIADLESKSRRAEQQVDEWKEALREAQNEVTEVRRRAHEDTEKALKEKEQDRLAKESSYKVMLRNLEHDNEAKDASLRKLHDEREAEVVELQSRLNSKLKELEKLETQHDDFTRSHEEKIREIKEEASMKTREIERRAEDQVDRLKRQVREMEEMISLHDSEKRQIRETHAKEVATYESEMIHLQSDLDSARSDLQILQRKLRAADEAAENLREEMQESVAFHEKQSSQLSQRLRKVEEELEEHRSGTGGVSAAKQQEMEEQVLLLQRTLHANNESSEQRENSLRAEMEAVLDRERRLDEELQGILKEFDRLAMNFTDFDGERRKLEKTIEKQRKSISELEKQLEHARADAVQADNNATLRAEFRRMMSQAREGYEEQLNLHIEKKNALDKELRRLKRENQAEVYGKQTTGTQTSKLYTESLKLQKP